MSIHISTNDPISFLFCGWVIFNCIYVPHLLYPSLHWWTFMLFPCPGYCKEHGNELWGACLWIMIFSGHMPRSGIAGSYVVLLLVSWGIFLLFFRLAVSVYIPTSSTGVFPFLHTLSSTHCLEIFFQHLLFVNFVMMTVPIHVRWYPVVLLICISPIISDVESLYMCLLSIFSCICMSSSKKRLFRSLAHFLIGLFAEILSCLSCLYIFETHLDLICVFEHLP